MLVGHRREFLVEEVSTILPGTKYICRGRLNVRTRSRVAVHPSSSKGCLRGTD